MSAPDPDWYRERPEPERHWRGVLGAASSPPGPGTRGGLDHELLLDDRRLPLYSAHLGASLDLLVGEPVAVRGKLVDLAGEGFGEELWPASVEPAGDR